MSHQAGNAGSYLAHKLRDRSALSQSRLGNPPVSIPAVTLASRSPAPGAVAPADGPAPNCWRSAWPGACASRLPRRKWSRFPGHAGEGVGKAWHLVEVLANANRGHAGPPRFAGRLDVPRSCSLALGLLQLDNLSARDPINPQPLMIAIIVLCPLIIFLATREFPEFMR
jgi:hypothetical protein